MLLVKLTDSSLVNHLVSFRIVFSYAASYRIDLNPQSLLVELHSLPILQLNTVTILVILLVLPCMRISSDHVVILVKFHLLTIDYPDIITEGIVECPLTGLRVVLHQVVSFVVSVYSTVR